LTERTSKKRRSYIILAILAAIVILPISVALIYLYNRPIDLSSRRVKIESMIEKRIGQKVTAETIILELFPSPRLTLTGLRFIDGGEPFIEIAELRARFYLTQLMAGNNVIKRLEITEPVIRIRRGADGSIKTIELIKAMRARIKRTARIRRMSMTGGRIDFTDEMPPTAETFKITGIEADFNDSRQGMLKYEVSAMLGSGTLSFKGKGQRFQSRLRLGGEAMARGLQIKRINPYLKMRGARPLPAGQGWQQGAALDFKTDMIWDSDGISLALEEIKLLMYDFEINGSLQAKTRTRVEGTRRLNVLESYEATLDTGPVPLGKFIALARLMAPGEELKKHLSELTPLDGKLSVEELSIKETFDVTGTAKGEDGDGTRSMSIRLGLENLRFKYRGLKETFSGVNGRVLYSGDTIAFEAMTGNYGAGVVKSFGGSITEIKTAPRYDISLKAFFEAGKTLAIVRKLLKKTLGKVPEKLKEIEASGLTDINLKIKSGLYTTSEADYSGTLILKKARFTHPNLPVTIRSLDGKLTFDNNRITLEGLRYADDESVLDLNGYVKDYMKKSAWFDISAEGGLHRSTLVRFVKSGPVKELLFDDRVPVKIRGRGTLKSLQADVYADLTVTALKFRGLIDKARDIPLTMDASIDYARKPGGPALRIKKMTLTAGGSRADIKAEFVHGSPYSATVESRSIRFSDIKGISAHIDSKADTAGFMELAVSVTGDGELEHSYSGRIALINGRLSTPLIPSPIKRLNAEINFEGVGAKLLITDFEAGTTRLIGSVNIDDIPTRSIRFDIQSSELRLEDLFTVKRPTVLPEGAPAPADASSLKDAAPKSAHLRAPPTRKITGNGTIKIIKGSAFGFTFDDLKAGVRLEEDAVYLSPVTLLKNKGPVSMDFTLYRRPSSRLIFDADISFIDINLEPFITELGSKKTIFAGDISGTAVLWGMRGKEPFTAGLNGEVKLSTGQGKMWKFLLLKKIFSIVNILSIDELFKDGLRYKTITGDFAIRDGIISTTNLSLYSDSLRMSAVGELKIPDAYIDGIIILHPFVTMDKLLTAIPLAGWIIGGEKGTTLSMYYQVVGPLKKPYIEPMPAKGLQDGIIGILKRLIEEPLGAPIKDDNGKADDGWTDEFD
jgi:uncharacterized protein involved in outer membrane biogenesis